MATLNESFPQGTDLGSGPRCQDTILGGAEAQTRFEAASKQSNDPPLSRFNTLRSGEDNMKLKELLGILYVVPTGKDNVIVSTGRTKVIPAGRTKVIPGSIMLTTS
ncbi:hypothetical protein Tco_1095687 [Tanacetum coccineum]